MYRDAVLTLESRNDDDHHLGLCDATGGWQKVGGT